MSIDQTGPAQAQTLDDLQPMQLDALREIGNIGAGNAATSLSQMLNHPVGMTVPHVRALPLEQVPAAVAGDDEAIIVAIYLKVLGDAPGHIMFAMNVEDARDIAATLLGGMDPGERDAFGLGEMERSALGEIGNILTSAYLIATTQITGLFLEPSPPEFGVDMSAALLGYVLSEVAEAGNTALVIETAFEELDQPISGSFLYIPTPEGLSRVLGCLGVGS